MSWISIDDRIRKNWSWHIFEWGNDWAAAAFPTVSSPYMKSQSALFLSIFQSLSLYVVKCVCEWLSKGSSRVSHSRAWEPKGQSLRSTRPVIGACCKISNNKICYNFGYVHEIAFCTAVPNLSQIGQPWFFTFSWGPPFGFFVGHW